MLIYFISISIACAFLVVYPYVIYPILLAIFPRKEVGVKSTEGERGQNFSLLFCAYNELHSMPSKVANLIELKKKYPDLEFFAFDDGSSDGTADFIEREAPFVNLVRGGGRNGKAHGMKILTKKAKTDFLIFTDANVVLDARAIDELASCYSDSNVGGVCGSLHYLGADGSTTAAVGGLYWRIEEVIKDLESRTGSVMGADGSIFSVRRAVYPDFPDTVLDDFTVSMEVVFSGYRLIKSKKVIAYEQLVSARSDEFSRKIRIAARAYHTHKFFQRKRCAMKGFDRFKYFSHKTLRWAGGSFLLIGAVSAIAAAFCLGAYWGAAFVMFLGALCTYALRASKGIASSIAEVALAMIATLIGVFQGMQGKTFSTWSPAKSR